MNTHEPIQYPISKEIKKNKDNIYMIGFMIRSKQRKIKDID